MGSFRLMMNTPGESSCLVNSIKCLGMVCRSCVTRIGDSLMQIHFRGSLKIDESLKAFGGTQRLGGTGVRSPG